MFHHLKRTFHTIIFITAIKKNGSKNRKIVERGFET